MSEAELVLTTVTPDMARRWLLTAPQRRMCMMKARIICARMNTADWKPSKHKLRPVKIRGGQLVDGNHRAMATVLRNKPTRIWVLWM